MSPYCSFSMQGGARFAHALQTAFSGWLYVHLSWQAGQMYMHPPQNLHTSD